MSWFDGVDKQLGDSHWDAEDQNQAIHSVKQSQSGSHSVNQSQSGSQSFNLSISQSINQSVNQPVNQSFHQSINQTISQPITPKLKESFLWSMNHMNCKIKKSILSIINP